MDFAVLRSGLIKSKNYCPNPLVKYPIPKYADAITNPKVKNTPAYNQFWEEQVYYCINGYDTGGIHLPGRYYKFVNNDTLRGIAGDNIRAELHDFQLDYAYLIEQSKKEHFNILAPKARRKTVTTMNIGMVVDYGYRFELNYKAAVVAGKQEFADIFHSEWKYLDSKTRAEFRIKKIPSGSSDDIISGYKDSEGIEQGTRNTVYFRTVFHDPNILKGKFLHDIVLEEAGENENLIDVINASRDCLMQGDVQRGTFSIYGTGGNMNKGSKGFKQLWHDYKAFNCVRLFIPSTVFYFPFYANATESNGKAVEDIPNLLHLQPHERVGWSDEERALVRIEERKKELLMKADMKEYFDFCQNNPTNVKEVFRKSSSNNFDIIALNDQGYKIESEERKYGKFKLEYKKDENGNLIMPYEVEAIPAKDDVPESECVMILHNGHPQRGYRFLETAGIDSYDQDQSKTSKSLGAMVVFRRSHNMGDHIPQWCPVALIRNRPKRKEEFYELCLKLSIYYDLIGTVLVDIRNGLVLQYFKDLGCQRFLSRRPKKFESPNSEQTNEFGFSLNVYSKPRMVGALQTFFYSHVSKVWFLNIIEEALNYDEFEADSDNDTVDALGIALMKALDMENVAVNEDDLLKANPYQYPEWGKTGAGNIVDITNVSKEMTAADLKNEDYFSRYARMLKHNEEDDLPTKDDIYSL